MLFWKFLCLVETCTSGDAVEEFRRAQRYANFKTNELNISESQGGQVRLRTETLLPSSCFLYLSSPVGCSCGLLMAGGEQLLSSMPYEHDVWGEGQYTHTLYRLGDRLPDWVHLSLLLS